MNRITFTKPILRWATALGLGLLVASLSPLVSAQRQLLDRVIAIVDSDVVLQSELDARLIEARGQAERSGRPIPAEDQFRSEILDLLVLENLQMQFAERVSIRFDDDTINRILANMASNNNMEFDQYVSVLEENGVYYQTREEVRKQMTLQELQRGLINSRIAITDQEIGNFLNSEMGREVMAADYLVDHILVPIQSDDSDAEKQAKLKYAADLMARVQEGENFSATRTAAQQAGVFDIGGTNFGWRKVDQLPTLFSDLVVEMTINDIEGPIEAGNGYHLIKLIDKRGGTEQFVKQTHIRHIMLAPNEIRNEEQTIAAITELRQRILDGENFETIARQNSDDFSSVVAGGDLDWINEGGMPPEMEVVIDQLEQDVLSEPFPSSTGWHIAEVLGRRVSDLSQEYSRQQAENVLRERKFDLELQNWLIEIREKAFVEYVD